jgi:hypothetical protein
MFVARRGELVAQNIKKRWTANVFYSYAANTGEMRILPVLAAQKITRDCLIWAAAGNSRRRLY